MARITTNERYATIQAVRKIALVLAVSLLTIRYSTFVSAEQPTGQRVYVVAATSYTTRDSVRWAEVQARWLGTDNSEHILNDVYFTQRR